MTENMQLFLASIGVFGSTSWAMFQFLMKYIKEGNGEIIQMVQEQLKAQETQRKSASDIWKEIIRSMQAFDYKLDQRLTTIDDRLLRVEDCACKAGLCKENDPPTGFP